MAYTIQHYQNDADVYNLLGIVNAKLQKVANGANSLAGIAHNPTVGFFTLTIFVLIVLSADNYIGFSRIATSVFGAGYTSIEESYREFHVKNNIK